VKRPDARRALAGGAALVTIALTAAAFWLSYEHLHDIADGNGLDGVRAWVWPATVDLFIVAGELLVLRASLRGAVDWWAYTLAAVGSLGSIALNVFGVGNGAQPMEYVVAAVPPTAALVAFGALMRQVHDALEGLTASERPRHTICTGPTGLAGDLAAFVAAGGASTAPVPVADPSPTGAVPVASETPAPVDSANTSERQNKPATSASDSTRTTDSMAAAPRQRAPRPGVSRKRNGRRSMTEWVELAGPVFHAEFERLRRQPTGDEFAEAIKKARLGTVSASTAKNIRAEILDRAELPALD
jgi:uncharacterized protein DUF2637